jgi:hypothetical protein
MTGLWKTRKTKPRFPFVSPGPWKSLRDSHIPTAPTVALFINGKQIRKTQERSPAECAPELYSFRLILGLENAASRGVCDMKVAKLRFSFFVPSSRAYHIR